MSRRQSAALAALAALAARVVAARGAAGSVSVTGGEGVAGSALEGAVALLGLTADKHGVGVMAWRDANASVAVLNRADKQRYCDSVSAQIEAGSYDVFDRELAARYAGKVVLDLVPLLKTCPPYPMLSSERFYDFFQAPNECRSFPRYVKVYPTRDEVGWFFLRGLPPFGWSIYSPWADLEQCHRFNAFVSSAQVYEALLALAMRDDVVTMTASLESEPNPYEAAYTSVWATLTLRVAAPLAYAAIALAAVAALAVRLWLGIPTPATSVAVLGLNASSMAFLAVLLGYNGFNTAGNLSNQLELASQTLFLGFDVATSLLIAHMWITAVDSAYYSSSSARVRRALIAGAVLAVLLEIAIDLSLAYRIGGIPMRIIAPALLWFAKLAAVLFFWSAARRLQTTIRQAGNEALAGNKSPASQPASDPLQAFRLRTARLVFLSALFSVPVLVVLLLIAFKIGWYRDPISSLFISQAALIGKAGCVSAQVAILYPVASMRARFARRKARLTPLPAPAPKHTVAVVGQPAVQSSTRTSTSALASNTASLVTATTRSS
jgi:hypothetical protein